MMAGVMPMKSLSKLAAAKHLGKGLRCGVVNALGYQRGGWALVSKLYSAQGIDLNAQFVKLPGVPSIHTVRLEYWYNFCWPEAQRLIDVYWPLNAEKMSVRQHLQREHLSQPIAVVSVTKNAKRFRHPSICAINKMDDPAMVLMEIAEDVRKVSDAELVGMCDPRRLALALADDANLLGVTAIPIRVAAALACANLKGELIEYAKAELGRLQARLPETASVYSLQSRYFEALIESVDANI